MGKEKRLLGLLTLKLVSIFLYYSIVNLKSTELFVIKFNIQVLEGNDGM